MHADIDSEGGQHARQIQGRVRRLRHLRPSRGGQPDLPRALCAAAPRPGERRHRRVRRHHDPPLARDGATSPTPSTSATLDQLPGHIAIGHVALFDRGREPAAERAADSDRLRARADRGLPQRQPGQRRASCATSSFATGPSSSRAATPRSSCISTRARRRLVGRGCARRIGRAGQGAFSFVMLTQGSADRRSRSARLPAARARPPRRRLRRLLRDVRPGSDWRDLRARRRARRGAGHQRRRPSFAEAVSAGAAGALRVRARVLRPAGQLRVRQERERGPHRARTRCSRASRRSTPTSSCRSRTPACARRSATPTRRACRCEMGLIRNHYVGRTFIQPQQSIRHFGVQGSS